MQAPQLLGRPEDLIKYGTSAEQSDSPLLGEGKKNSSDGLEESAKPDTRGTFERILDENLTAKEATISGIPALVGAKTAIPYLSRGAAFLGMPKLAAFTGGYALGNAADNYFGISDKIGNTLGPILAQIQNGRGTQRTGAFSQEELDAERKRQNDARTSRGEAPILGNAGATAPTETNPTLQDLADQRAQNSGTEDDKVDSLQNAIKGVPAGPQVAPGALPTPQEAGEGLMNAAKEFYPNASFKPEAPAAPALPDPARTGLSTDQMQGLSPDLLKAISSEVPEGLGPLRPVDPRTGEFLSPEVIAAGKNAGLTFPSQVALPQVQAPVSAPPMSAEGQGRGTAVDAQGYFNDITDERPLTPEEIKAGEAFADRRGFDFNPQTGFSSITDPGSKTFDTPATLENFQNRGLSLGQFMRYEDDPSQRTEQFVDEQGRLRRRLTVDAATLQGFSPERINQDRPLAPEFAQAEATGDQMMADLRAKEADKDQGRAFTDSELRRAFGDNYQEAIIKDRNGINPFTDKTYADEELERENLREDTEARKRSGVDDPPESPTKIIEDARAKAEAMAAASGLSPDDPDYEDFILDSIETITKIPRYRKPIPRLTDAEANALYEKGDIDADYQYINEKGEIVKYVPEEKAAESKGRKKDPRSRAAEARKNR